MEMRGRPRRDRDARAVQRIATPTGRGGNGGRGAGGGVPGARGDAGGDIRVLELVAATDVVDLARDAFVHDDLDSGAVVADVEPVAGLAAIAGDRQGPPPPRVRREQ